MKIFSTVVFFQVIATVSLMAQTVEGNRREQDGGRIADVDSRWERDMENADNPNYVRRNSSPYYSNSGSSSYADYNYDASRGQTDPGMKPDSNYYYPDYRHNSYYHYNDRVNQDNFVDRDNNPYSER